MAIGEREVLDLDELLAGSWRLLLQTAARDPHEIDELIHATIGPVIDADVSSSADLVPTLRTYYAHEARTNATAATIHAHRHTISYRLGRIAELIGHDPQTPGGQSQLTLGLPALALRHATSATTT